MVVLDTVKYLQNHVPAFLKPEPVPHGNPVMKLKGGTLLREPYGVVGIISPWNYPFSLPSIQTLTALATGNAVVLKPSEFTPYSSLELEKLLRAAGLDPDLLQVITGDGAAGAALLAANVQKIVFTGSVATGKRVAQAAAARLLPVVLELGGKDPMIVLEDADIDVASSAAVWGAFMNAGTNVPIGRALLRAGKNLSEVSGEVRREDRQTRWVHPLRRTDSGDKEIHDGAKSGALLKVEPRATDPKLTWPDDP